MASSEENLRWPESCRPSRSVTTKSSGASMPLFMQVGVVRMRLSSRRTDTFPSQATLKPCSYIQRPAIQISRRCCSSVLALPGKSESVDIGGHLPGSKFPFKPFGDKFSCDADGIQAVHRGTLSVNAAHLERAGYAIDGQHVRRYSIVDLMRFGVAYHFIEGIFHNIHKALVYFALPPEKALAVLHPLEIADCNAACIAKDIGHGENTFGVNDGVGLPGGRAVGAFAEDFCLHLMGVPLGNLIFDGGGDRDLAWLKENVACTHLCPAARKIV